MRKILAFLIGIWAGIMWLSPVFVSPMSGVLMDQNLSSLRIVRVGAALSLVLFMRRSVPARLVVGFNGIMLLVVFFAVPLCSWLVQPTLLYGVAVCGPILTAGAVLFMACTLSEEEFLSLVLGITTAAFGFLMAGVFHYGFEESTVYGRSRAHFGFNHPIQTASAIVAAAVFIELWIQKFVKTKHALLACQILLAAITFRMLMLAGSRNFIFFGITAGLGFLVSHLLQRRTALRISIATAIALVPPTLYTFSYLTPYRQPIFGYVDVLSSWRLRIYRSGVSTLINAHFPLGLIGLSTEEFHVGTSWAGITRGFAAVDSIYLSYWWNFGLVGISLLGLYFISIGYQLTYRQKHLQFGLWCAAILFFTLDAQGLTTSNWVIFLVLLYLQRTLMSRQRA